MKKIIIIVLLVTTNLYSQKYVDSLYNFKTENGNIFWQKVFETKEEDSKKQFKDKLFLDLKTKDLKETEKKITFNIENESINFKKYGGKSLFTAFYIQQTNNHVVKIDFKEHKYRVTITNLTSATMNTGVRMNLEEYVVRKNQIKTAKTHKKGLKIYDKHFTEKFTIKETTQNDW
jgi:hypothetical protein